MSIVGVTASSRRQVPNAPTIGTATDVGTSRAYNNGAATVAFTPSAIGFEATSFTATSSPGGYTATGASSPLTITGLQSNVAYTFTVTATNFVGTSSASSASNSITATTVPQAPTIGTPTLANGQAYTGSANIGVAFTANATGGKTITGFNVLSSSAATGSGSSSPISVSDTVGNARTYTVTASNANGTSLASSASTAITPSSVPQAPTITSVTNVSGQPSTAPQASVSFHAGATGGSAITSFRVTSSSGAFTTGASSPLVVTETSTGTYTYTVFATNARGNSVVSPGVSASLSSVPVSFTIGTLSNVTGIPFGSNPQFTLTFTTPPAGPPSMAVTDYEYSTDGGVTFAQVLTPAGGIALTSPFTLTVASTGTRTVSYAGDPFVAGTSYTVILIANNAYGSSAPTSPSNSRVAATAPSVPTFTLSSTGITNITNTFSYNNGGLAVTSDSPTLSPAISTTFGGISPVGNTSGALTYTGSFVQGTTYTVPMSLTNPIGTATATSKTIIPYAAAVPSAPASLSAVVAGTTSVTLTYGAISQNGSALTAWTGSGTSTGDIVSTPAVNLTYSGTPSTAGGTVTVTGTFAAATSYTFSLRARNSVGAGTTRTSNGVVPLPSITDNFNRTGSALGTTSSGSAWNTPAGSWSTNGSLAVAGSDNSLGSVAFGNTVATVTADNGTSLMAGYGVAYWISSGSSYYQSYYQTYTYPYTYNSGSAYCADCVSYSCSQIPSTTTYAATATTTYGNYVYAGSATSYSATIYGRQCTSTNVANPSSSCTAVGQCRDTDQATGVICLTQCDSGGNKTSVTATTCYLCSSGVNGPNPSTGSGSIGSCYVQSSTTTYSCPSGGTLSGTTCTVTTYVSGGTWPNCSGAVGTSYSIPPNTTAQGCGGCTTNGGGGAYIQPTATAYATGHLIRTGANGGSLVSSSDLGQSVSKITVVTSSGSSVTVTGFNSAGTQIYNSGAITPVATPTKVGNYGIFRGNSLNYAGVDNFSVS